MPPAGIAEEEPFSAAIPPPPPLPEGFSESLAEMLSGAAENAGESERTPLIEEAMTSPPPTQLPETGLAEEAMVGTGAAEAPRRGPWRLVAIALLAAAAGLAAYQFRDTLLSWLPAGEQGDSTVAEASEDSSGSSLPGDPRGGSEPVVEAGRVEDAAQPPKGQAGAPAAAVAVAGPAPATAPATNQAGAGATGGEPPVGDQRSGSAQGIRAGETQSLDGPFTRLESITWSETGGETVIVLTADGPIRPGKFDVVPIGTGDPRVLVRLAGVDRPFAGGGVAIGSAHVRRARTGLHTVPEGREIHVVFDLVDARVEVDRVEPQGNGLALFFARR